MINLLPPIRRQEISYARKNFWLVRLCVIFLVIILGVAGLTGLGIIYLNNSTHSYQDQITHATESLNNQQLDRVEKQADEISNNIKLATDVLSRQVLFSKLIRQIGSAMPTNTSLSDLKITKGENGITLTADASDYDAATQVQVNLADPKNKIFSKADIVSINCNNATGRYPCTVVVRALFGDNASYLFIPPKTKKAAS
jgi:hypothetical protein